MGTSNELEGVNGIVTESRDDDPDDSDGAGDADDRDWPVFEGIEVFKGRSRGIDINDEE